MSDFEPNCRCGHPIDFHDTQISGLCATTMIKERGAVLTDCPCAGFVPAESDDEFRTTEENEVGCPIDLAYHDVLPLPKDATP